MKLKRLQAAVTAAVLVTVYSPVPALYSGMETGTVKAAYLMASDNCTARISVVDINTGKNIEGFELRLKENPLGTSISSPVWKTTEEPVKEFTDLWCGPYAVEFENGPDDYYFPSEEYFEFENEGEIKDIVYRAVPKTMKKKIILPVWDWTNAVSGEYGDSYIWYNGYNEYTNRYLQVEVYDEKGEYFTHFTGGNGYYCYLPDGKYKIKVTACDRDYEVINDDYEDAENIRKAYSEVVFPDSDGFMDIEVVNGEISVPVLLLIRMKPDVVELRKDGCKANISVVDYYTGEPVEGVALKICPSFGESREVIEKWNTTDSPVKKIKNLHYLSWYDVAVTDVPEGYFITESTSFNLSIYDGMTEDVVIYAFPDKGDPNVNVTVYDWTNLIVDPSDGTYKGYRKMEADEYGLLVYDDDSLLFELNDTNVHLPDGKYYVTTHLKDSKYRKIDAQGYKARAVRKIFGKEFEIPEGYTYIEIKDGKTFGQPCLYYEKETAREPECILNLNVVDGVTGDPVSDVSYKVVRIDEEYEDKDERLYDVDIFRGFMPSYGDSLENGAVTAENLEPFVKYFIEIQSEDKKYCNTQPVSFIFSKDGETKDITMKLMPYESRKGDVNRDNKVNMVDMLMMERKLLYSFYYDIEDTDNADFNDDGIVNILDLIGIKSKLLNTT